MRIIDKPNERTSIYQEKYHIIGLRVIKIDTLFKKKKKNGIDQ